MSTQYGFEGRQPEDNEIIEMYWQRNEQAIAETDKKYGKYLFTIAYNILHDRLDGEECVNDTYAGVWNTIPPARPRLFQAFIGKITHNIAVDRYRERSAAKRVPSEMTVSLEELDSCMAFAPSVDEEYAVHELSRLLDAYLRSLGEREEFIFICRYYYSDQIATIAQMIGSSESTVYKALADMRKKLKEKLQEEGLFDE